MEVLNIIGALIMLLGSFFLFSASIGLIRMPDFYSKIQAGTKASTLGSMLILVGIGFINPLWWPKLLIIIVFILFTNPISSHAIARAVHDSSIEEVVMQRDDLDRYKNILSKEDI